MNNIEIFKNNEFGEIRTIIKENGEPMFCLSDICRILELENPSKTSTRLNSGGITKSYIGINTGLRHKM